MTFTPFNRIFHSKCRIHDWILRWGWQITAILAAILSICKVAQCVSPYYTGGFIIPRSVIWVTAATFLIVALQTTPGIHINRRLLAFSFISLISLIINQPLETFHAWERLGYFGFMLCVIGPMIQSPLLSKARHIMWEALLWSMRFTIIWSTEAYISSLCEVAANKISIHHSVFFFYRGVTTHFMLLAPIAAIVMVDSFWHVLWDSIQIHHCKRDQFLMRLLWLMLGCAAGWLLIKTSSRISIAGGAVAILIIIWYSRKRLVSIVRRRRKITTILAIAVVTAISIGGSHLTDGVSHKIKSQYERYHSFTHSRDGKWADRWEEFKSSPIIGIGFDVQGRATSPYDDPNWAKHPGPAEPGTSWLSILAQTGILGSCAFISFMASVFRDKRHRCGQGTHNESAISPRRLKRHLYISLLAILIINGIAEGWVLYAGSIQFYIFWLLCDRMLASTTSTTAEHQSI